MNLARPLRGIFGGCILMIFGELLLLTWYLLAFFPGGGAGREFSVPVLAAGTAALAAGGLLQLRALRARMAPAERAVPAGRIVLVGAVVLAADLLLCRRAGAGKMALPGAFLCLWGTLESCVISCLRAQGIYSRRMARGMGLGAALVVLLSLLLLWQRVSLSGAVAFVCALPPLILLCAWQTVLMGSILL